jgi:hypothetical protein
MPNLPSGLASRLNPDERKALERFMRLALVALERVYAFNVEDYRESRGDDAALFGLKVWKHLWYALEQDLLEDAQVQLVEMKGTYEVRIGPLRIGVYGLGHSGSDDVLQRFPDTSPSKRNFGEENQLRLFRLEQVEAPPDESSFALDSLTLGHFGNARDGFIKCYLGAWVVEASGLHHWAWIERIGEPGEGLEPLPVRPPVTPFSDQPREALEVRPRTSA